MSLVPADTIKVIAESIGIVKISDDDVYTEIAVDLEYRLREILQDSIKMMKHSKRTRIQSEDINSALSLQKYECLYGYSYKNALNFLRVVGQKDLFCLEENELDIKDLINDPLPSPPKDVVLQSHWLAIHGRQPLLLANLGLDGEKDDDEERKVGEKRKLAKRDLRKESKGDIPRGVKHVLARELELYYHKVTEIVTAHGKAEGLTQQMDALFSSVLQSIGGDPGLHQLVPYFSKFIVTEVSANLTNLAYLKTLMQFTDAFFSHPSFRLEPYLNQLMPAIVTCLVGKRLCADYTEDHWGLRDYVAQKLLPKACRIGKEYFIFQARVIKTLANTFLDITRTIPAHYGALKGLVALGQKVVQIVVIPNLAAYMKMLNMKKDSMGSILVLPQRFLLESAVIRDALMGVACEYLGSMASYYKSFASLLSNDDDGRMKKRDDEMEYDAAHASPRATLQYVHELIRQESATLASDTTLNETIALSELAEVGKRFREVCDVFGQQEVAQALAPHADFFAQCVQWDRKEDDGEI